ncbi:MAG TPA: glycosyl transferase family 2 [Parvularcula sp.]|nr:glycosyl transferase family 2 [Parvularcula sp.]
MFDRAPLSVVIPTLEAASGLPATLAALAPAAISGLIREVIVVDGGSRDETRVIAEASGAAVISTAPGRGGQLRAGAAAARGGWLLFLHADTVLETGWQDEAAAFIKDDAGRAAVFTLAFDAKGLAPVLVAAGAMIRTGIFRSPYGDQGLMLPRRLYVEAGGFREIPLMEDVDFIDRLNRKGGFKVLKAIATTSAQRYQRDGYARRVLLNSLCLAMFRLGVAPEKIRSLYR